MPDIESWGVEPDRFANKTIQYVLWKGITVKQRDKFILRNVHGMVKAGEVLAIMGPSGSGKSTLLKRLAGRPCPASWKCEGAVVTNSDTNFKPQIFRKDMAFVEQQDALIGSLTVRETLRYAADLALSTSTTRAERKVRIDTLLRAFGLSDQSHSCIGTPITKGISGGQKRRVSVASQLITEPKVLFLDEPTSGLDFAAASEVMKYLRAMAETYQLIVIVSLHQPSTTILEMCDRLLLLSRGRTAYHGPRKDLPAFFDQCGRPIPHHMNPAEFALDFVDVDFLEDRNDVNEKLEIIRSCWKTSRVAAEDLQLQTNAQAEAEMCGVSEYVEDRRRGDRLATMLTLIRRSSIKSYRDFVAYGIRIAMYLGLALMMGTIWLRLEPVQDNIQSFVNAIFFGGAFMSFMAVAYIPAFLEDYAIFIREHTDGLCDPTSFILANFITGIPFLFLITVLFSVVAYWLSNFRPTATAFFTWIMWLFLDLIAAESLVVLISSLVPIFVVALAGTAFANGLWMCTGGFFVPLRTLNAFWRYLFHYIDYQSYVFEGMMVNEFAHRTYKCGSTSDGPCKCLYDSALADQCLIDGNVILYNYGFGQTRTGRSVAVMVAIIVGYRALTWIVLYLKTRQ